MSLSLAFSSALSGLTLSKRGTQIVADNISNANTEGYGVRSISQSARAVGGTGNGVSFNGINRHVDPGLVGEFRQASGKNAGAALSSAFWQKIEMRIGVPGDPGSLADQLSEFDLALQRARLSSDQPAMLQQVVQSAIDLTNTIKGIDTALQQERDRADAGIKREIDWLNASLESIADLNREIQRQSLLGGMPQALMDNRQQLVDQVAMRMPIREFPREDGRILLMSLDGSILVDRDAAKFDFTRTLEPGAGELVQNGALSSISLNGRQIAETSLMFSTGQIGAFLSIRDEAAPQVQASLDGITADLVARFASVEPGLSLASGEFGFFSLAGQTSFAGAFSGISGSIEVNPSIMAESWRVRDGLAAAAPGNPLDNTLLNLQVGAIDRFTQLDSGLAVNRNLHGHISDLTGVVSGQRLFAEHRETQFASNHSALREVLAAQGVDTDHELSKLLVLEQAYSANARVLSTIDSMMRILMEI